MRYFTWFLAVLIFCSGTMSSAQTYKWVDEKGTINFSSTPPPEGQKVKTYSGSMDYVGKPSSKGHEKSKRSKNNDVELYITEWCPYCKKAIKFLQSKNIRAKIYDIEKDASAKRRKDKLDYKNGVPFAVINGTKIHGFDIPTYTRALNL